jgi:hypothetical protein
VLTVLVGELLVRGRRPTPTTEANANV